MRGSSAPAPTHRQWAVNLHCRPIRALLRGPRIATHYSLDRFLHRLMQTQCRHIWSAYIGPILIHWQNLPRMQWANAQPLAAEAAVAAAGPSKYTGRVSQKNNEPMRSHRKQQLPPQWGHPNVLAAFPGKVMAQCEAIGSGCCCLNWANPNASAASPRNIIGQHEAIKSRCCRCNGLIPIYWQHLPET